MNQRGSVVVVVVTGCLLPMCLVPMAWWSIGDLTESQVRGRPDLSYLLTPPDVDRATEHAALLLSGVIGVLLTGVIIAVISRYGPTLLALGIAAGLWVIGFCWGLFFRVLTVGASGANMSALAFLFVPVLLGARRSWSSWRAGSFADPSPDPSFVTWRRVGRGE